MVDLALSLPQGPRRAVGRWLAPLGISTAGTLIIVSRRPDALFNPQFWAEDGTIWYAEAHAHGLRSLLSPYLGYFQTLPRVVAVAAQILPLTWAPFAFNLVAVALMLLPVWLLASQRFARLASLRVRLGFGFLILALPNTHSLCANVTNSQWYLALAALLVLLAEPTEAPTPAFDLTVLGLCAVSGPFAIFLAPVAALMWWKRKTGNTPSRGRARMLILAAGCLLQGLGMWLVRSDRPRVALGASPLRLAQILAVNVFLTPVLGGHAALPYVHPGAAIVAATLGLGIMAYAVVRGLLELRMFFLFAGGVLASALALPLGADWDMLAKGYGERYFFFAMLAWVASLLWMLRGPTVGRLAAVTVLCLIPLGAAREWRYPAFADLNFPAYCRRYAALEPGQEIEIPINPPGWSMRLQR
jgi:hypothetical protein